MKICSNMSCLFGACNRNMAAHMLPVTLTFDSSLPRLIQSGVCVTLCHYLFLPRENPDKLFLQSVNFPAARETAEVTVEASGQPAPLQVPLEICVGVLQITQTVMEINSTAFRRTRLPFSSVDVTSDRPLLANDDLWSSLKRSAVGDANLQTLTSGAAADLSRCWSATQWLYLLLQFYIGH